jgi:hypothetical protein
MSGLNRIDIVIPGSSSTAAAQRDQAVTRLIGLGGIGFNFYHYSDINSGNGGWGYWAHGYGYADGVVTFATVTCTGMAVPPSGSDLVAMPDPGPGTLYTWSPCGAALSIKTGGGVLGSGSPGGSAPPQNNNYWVWNIAARSSTVVTDFTNAINKFAQLSNNFNYYKYVDSVSGAWAVYALTEQNNAAGGPPFYFMVTCNGTPKPPTGSLAPAVALPAFTQSFTLISCPLMFGPKR